VERRRQQRAWYWYDWANSAYVTTTATVIIGPYLTAMATSAACPGLAEGQTCFTPVLLLGLFPVLPGALPPFLVTIATLVSAVVLILVGALVDRSPSPHRWLGGFAWTGAAAATAMFWLEGSAWQAGAALMMVASLCAGGSFVVYDAILCRIATPDERDRVSSRGWAFGYAGGGLLLALNLVVMTAYESLGISYGLAIRLSLLSAGLWWAAFTIIPVLGLRNLPKAALGAVRPEGKGAAPGPLRQLATTFRDLRRYPNTLLFLLAYLFFNDGIQTVIVQSSLFATQELRMGTSQVMVTFLLTQIVAFGGALLFGRLAAAWGAKRTVLTGLVIWLGVVSTAFVMPAGVFGWLLVLGAAIGLVMGGTQALSRSMYSQLVPATREAEYFSFYQAAERGTSWLGTLTFGLVFQFSGSYRYALLALVGFFIVGGALLARVDMRKGIVDAGNALPEVF
jgi:UMF1 family MFS transporter